MGRVFTSEARVKCPKNMGTYIYIYTGVEKESTTWMERRGLVLVFDSCNFLLAWNNWVESSECGAGVVGF